MKSSSDLVHFLSTVTLGWHLQAHLRQLSLISSNGIFKPIPDTIDPRHYFVHQRVQIFGHSSVQSSSTFKLQTASMPISLFKFKKIQQGHLLYPKIFPPIFHARYYPRVSRIHNLELKIQLGFSSARLLLALLAQIRVCVCTKIF